jgi:hypothetical protein
LRPKKTRRDKMSSPQKENKKKELETEFDRIKQDQDIDISRYLARREDLPDLGEIEIYDYQQDIAESVDQANELLEGLVDLYLGDASQVVEHRYIRNKMREDAAIYAETIFLQRMTRKNFLTQLKQVDNGDNSARMHEVVNQTITQIRENSKFSSTQRTELEKFYKEIRKDLGLNEITTEASPAAETEAEEAKVMDHRGINDMIELYLKNRPS